MPFGVLNARGLIASWVRLVSLLGALFTGGPWGAAATLLIEGVEPVVVLIGDPEKRRGSTDVSKKTMPITAAIVLIARIVERT
jgi:hypothetical protein